MYDQDDVYFDDREDAGRRLAAELEEYRGQDAIVLALPRGGVVVGYQIARHLGLPLDVIVTRKIGAPGNPEYAIGAVAENGEAVLNEDEINAFRIPQRYVEAETARQLEEAERRVVMYRQGKRLPDLKGKVAIVVDDGIATGFTMFAAVKAVRAEDPKAVVVAVPVGPPSSLSALRSIADRVVYLSAPTPFWAVGSFYRRFDQVSDNEVMRYLSSARGESTTSAQESEHSPSD